MLLYLYKEDKDLQEKIFEVPKQVSRVVQDFEFVLNSNFFLNSILKLGYRYLTRIRIPCVSLRILDVSCLPAYRTRDTLVELRIRACYGYMQKGGSLKPEITGEKKEERFLSGKVNHISRGFR